MTVPEFPDIEELGCPLLRLPVMVECGSNAVLVGVFGTESEGEVVCTLRLLNAPDRIRLDAHRAAA